MLQGAVTCSNVKRISINLSDDDYASLVARAQAEFRSVSSTAAILVRAGLGTTLVERGRQLASERDDLIAQGVNPADLTIPLAPLTPEAPVSTTEKTTGEPCPLGWKQRPGTARCFNCGRSRSKH